MFYNYVGSKESKKNRLIDVENNSNKLFIVEWMNYKKNEWKNKNNKINIKLNIIMKERNKI